MPTCVVDRLADIDAGQWNALLRENYPFARHEFLVALEEEDCLGERTGWIPRHVIHTDAQGRLLGAAPLYQKFNSFGEFVFDWSWADAYQRHGRAYYPKLVSAIPFTPATGPRLLIRADADQAAVATTLMEGSRQLADELNCSSLHWLFTTPDEQELLAEQGFMTRIGCQFHWHNAGYRDFDGFLAALNTKRRKNIKRERRLVNDAGLSLRVVNGEQASASDWDAFYRFYCNTFRQRGNYPALTRSFFQRVGRTLGQQILLVLAMRDGIPVAGALSYQSDTTLYGRHWGCHADHDSLHFEVCYYQGIEHCIRTGLRHFEPGAQGEHKVWRGFLPTLTYSAHWLAHPGFSAAIADFLHRESPAVRDYARGLGVHSPYRRDGTEP